MTKRTIKIGFVDFQGSFDVNDNFFIRHLSDRYEIVLDHAHPDYLFYSVFGNEHFKHPECVKIFWTGENQVPDFNFCDYALGFDYMSFGDRYLRFPLYLMYESDYALMLKRSELKREDLLKKTGFCSFVYSNNFSSPERQQFFNLLSQYKTVSSGGRYLNNVGGPMVDKLAFQQQHKFSIAFENSCHAGYTTEKLVQAFAAGTIPIYWGDPCVVEEFNPHSFINCADYASFEEVVAKVRYLDENEDAYLQMMHENPVVGGSSRREAELEKLNAFFDHIFTQDIERSKRFDRHYWNRVMTKTRLQQIKAFDRSFVGMVRTLYFKLFYRRLRYGNNSAMFKIHQTLRKYMRFGA